MSHATFARRVHSAWIRATPEVDASHAEAGSEPHHRGYKPRARGSEPRASWIGATDPNHLAWIRATDASHDSGSEPRTRATLGTRIEYLQRLSDPARRPRSIKIRLIDQIDHLYAQCGSEPRSGNLRSSAPTHASTSDRQSRLAGSRDEHAQSSELVARAQWLRHSKNPWLLRTYVEELHRLCADQKAICAPIRKSTSSRTSASKLATEKATKANRMNACTLRRSSSCLGVLPLPSQLMSA